MATLLVDSPPEKQGEHGSAGTSGEPPPASSPPPAVPERGCASCGAPMAAGQDWCTQCGAGVPGSLATPSWRSATAILTAVAVLVLGAGVAAYAALKHSKSKPRVVIATVARIPAPTTTTPPASTSIPGNLGTVPKVKSSLPLGAFKPPKIPLTAATPKAPASSTTPTSATKTGTSGTGTTTSTTPSSSGAAGEAAQPAAILLDTNAATTYNPYNLPAGGFGDPSLAIDGDPSTAWTATVDPASAPSMAEGLLIDLKSKQRVALLKLISSTAGMTVQVYATKAQTAPASITDPAWVTLTHSEVAKKKHLRLTLRDSKQAFSFLALWISRAPKSSIGTPQAPGHVDVNEIELFPPS
jgi:hypothetical protein